MQGTQLYDSDSSKIYPSTYAANVDCGVVVQGNTVYEDISLIFSQVQTIRRQISGAATVENSLNIIVTYSTNNYNNKNDAENATYTEDFVLPTAEAPYAWQKTLYYWGEDIVKTTYIIVSTALYPETLIMYASTGTSVSGSSLSGPGTYSAESSGVPDRSANGVTWYYYFPGIDGSKSVGYMAVRHRDAGKAWPQNAVWLISQMAQYPITS